MFLQVPLFISRKRGGRLFIYLLRFKGTHAPKAIKSKIRVSSQGKCLKENKSLVADNLIKSYINNAYENMKILR